MKAIPYLTEHTSVDACLGVLAKPLRPEVQADGRMRHWGEAMRGGGQSPRILRVVTLDDGETIHNAFFDRGTRQEGS